MLDEILDDEKFSAMMKRHVFECVEYLLKNDRSFSAMANLDLVKFIRDSQNITPIMLLQGVSVPSVFKTIYYARVNDFIVKPYFVMKSFYFTFLGFARCF